MRALFQLSNELIWRSFAVAVTKGNYETESEGALNNTFLLDTPHKNAKFS